MQCFSKLKRDERSEKSRDRLWWQNNHAMHLLEQRFLFNVVWRGNAHTQIKRLRYRVRQTDRDWDKDRKKAPKRYLHFYEFFFIKYGSRKEKQTDREKIPKWYLNFYKEKFLSNTKEAEWESERAREKEREPQRYQHFMNFFFVKYGSKEKKFTERKSQNDTWIFMKKSFCLI